MHHLHRQVALLLLACVTTTSAQQTSLEAAWVLSDLGVLCVVACEGRGLECDLDTTLSLSGATNGAMLTAINEAGGSCTSVTSWGYIPPARASAPGPAAAVVSRGTVTFPPAISQKNP